MGQEDCCWELGWFVRGILGILPNMEFDLECDAEFGAEVAGFPTCIFIIIRAAPFVSSTKVENRSTHQPSFSLSEFDSTFFSTRTCMSLLY